MSPAGKVLDAKVDLHTGIGVSQMLKPNIKRCLYSDAK